MPTEVNNQKHSTKKMRSPARLLQYWPGFYWLCFAGFTFDAVTNSGFSRHSDKISFPWIGVIVMWLLLAIGVAVLHKLLQPTQGKTIWQRVKRALLVFCILLVLCLPLSETDMPGLTYIPFDFVLITFIGLLMFAFGIGFKSIWKRVHN